VDTVTCPTSTSSYRLKLQYLYQNEYLKQVNDANAAAVFCDGDSGATHCVNAAPVRMREEPLPMSGLYYRSGLISVVRS
jgi:hypothetical protein